MFVVNDQRKEYSRYGEPVQRMAGILGQGCLDKQPHQWVEDRWFVDARTGNPGTVCRVCELELT